MKLSIWTDGGARGNPGPAGAGIYIRDENGRTVCWAGFYLGEATNNVAEYQGLLRGLRAAKELGGTQLAVHCDSELIVKQVNGQYKVKNPTLRSIYEEVIAEMANFEQVTVKHVYRSDNAQADQMVNEAVDARGDVSKGETETQTSPAAGSVSSDLSNAVYYDLEIKTKKNLGRKAREELTQTATVSTELCCLKAGESSYVNTGGKSITLTIVSGAGTAIVDGESQGLKPGSYLYSDSCDTLKLKADGQRQLVGVLTAW